MCSGVLALKPGGYMPHSLLLNKQEMTDDLKTGNQ